MVNEETSPISAEFAYGDAMAATMMEAIQFSRTGGPEVLETVKRSIPVPGPGEVLVKAHAIGVAYFDMLIRSGRYRGCQTFPTFLATR